MADRKAHLVVRANRRNVQGYTTEFDIVTDLDEAGAPIFGDTVTIKPMTSVLVISGDGIAPGVYRVTQGSPMVAHELQPQVGDLVRITAPVDVSPTQAGTLWMCLSDGSFRQTTESISGWLAAKFDELFRRLPTPEDLTAEVAVPAHLDGDLIAEG